MKIPALLLILLMQYTSSFLHAQADLEFDYHSLIGTEAKDFTARTLQGSDFDLSAGKGKILMLVFWNKHCGGCNKEIPDLNRIVEENASGNFQLISIIDQSVEDLTNTDTTPYNLRIHRVENGFYEYNQPIFKNTKINYEIVVEGYPVRELYGIPITSPIVLFIDEHFIIRDFNVGYYVYNNYEHLNDKLSGLLAN